MRHHLNESAEPLNVVQNMNSLIYHSSINNTVCTLPIVPNTFLFAFPQLEPQPKGLYIYK